MDSYYPQFGEVELVLVDDENDFFDPLETNFECEDENEDTNLQLNDNIYDETEFHLITDNSRKNSVTDEIVSSEIVRTEVFNKICDSRNVSSHGVKIECHDESSSDSIHGKNDDIFQNSYSDDTIDEIIEIKTEPKEITRSNITKPQIPNEKNEPVATECVKIKSVKHLREPNKKKRIRSQAKVKYEENVTANTSQNNSNNGKKIRKKPPKEEKAINRSSQTNEDKGTRHYSKRNQTPKQVTHNEAFDKKLLFCKICNLHFERSPFFTEHMRSKHSIDKPFECYICSKPYRICSLLAEHIRYHFGEKPYQCKFCDRSFSQLQPYKAHIRKSHTNERPYKCNFLDGNNVKCEETFFDTKTYKFHMREHTNEQPFTCEFCSKKFNHSGTYQAHMRIHTNERPYQCVICGKSFAQISTHKAHMLTHSDEFKFPCTEPGCDKKFKQATNLKLHMRVHTKETPYKCEDCGRGFAQLVTYRNHRRIHTGEKPFQCTYTDCGKCFRHRNSFRRHLQTHTGEKPFECKICFKRLSQTSSYVSHMRRHEKPEKS